MQAAAPDRLGEQSGGRGCAGGGGGRGGGRGRGEEHLARRALPCCALPGWVGGCMRSWCKGEGGDTQQNIPKTPGGKWKVSSAFCGRVGGLVGPKRPPGPPLRTHRRRQHSDGVEGRLRVSWVGRCPARSPPSGLPGERRRGSEPLARQPGGWKSLKKKKKDTAAHLQTSTASSNNPHPQN